MTGKGDPPKHELAGAGRETERVRIRQDVTYKKVGSLELKLDVYSPGEASKMPRPAVIFLPGDAAPEVLRNAREWTQYVRWGQRVAAAGLIGIAANRRSTERGTKFDEAAQDVDDLLSFVRSQAQDLGIDQDRLCLWTCAAGAPVALRTALRDAPAFVRGIVVYYGLLDLRHLRARFAATVTIETLQAFSPISYLAQSGKSLPPMLVVRAGRDSPEVNIAVDHFVVEALAKNVPLELVNHPAALHAFDVRDNDERTNAIVKRTLAFMLDHLGVQESVTC